VGPRSPFTSSDAFASQAHLTRENRGAKCVERGEKPLGNRIGNKKQGEHEAQKKGGENNQVFTSRGGWGVACRSPQAAQQACPARQVCGLTRGLLFGNSIGDSPPKSFSFSGL